MSTIVLYYGREKRDGPESLFAMCEFSEDEKLLAENILSDYHIHIVSISQLDEKEINI